MLASFRRFLSDFAAQTGMHGLYGLGLSFAGALTDGIGFLLLLPILQIATGDNTAAWAETSLNLLSNFGFTTPLSQTIAFLSVFLFLMLLRNFLAWHRAIVLAKLSQGYVDHWRMRVFRTMARADWPQLLAMRRHEGQHALLQDVVRLAAGSHHLLRGAVAIFFIVVQLIVSAIVSPGLTALIILIIILSSTFAPRVLRLSRQTGQGQTMAGTSMHETLAQFSGALKLIKVHRDESAYEAAFDHKVASLREQRLRFASQQALSQSLLQMATAVLLCIIVMIGLFVFNVTPLTLIALVIILARTSAPLYSLFNGAQVIANMLPAYETLDEFTSSLRNEQNSFCRTHKAISPSEPIGVDFCKVSFQYPSQKSRELDNLTLSIKPGQMVALVGPSGTGKTTVLDLMTGLLQTTDGSVKLNDSLMSTEADWASIAHSIAFAPQDPFLLDVSLRENLVWSGDNPSQETIDHALHVSGAQSILTRLPNGLHSRAGERGQNLSGGERQRFCLARALIRKPGLLILDEATSALDRESEAEILSKLASLERRPTIVIVSHRELDRNAFDQIIRLNGVAHEAQNE